jgi:hypothetical protein
VQLHIAPDTPCGGTSNAVASQNRCAAVTSAERRLGERDPIVTSKHHAADVHVGSFLTRYGIAMHILQCDMESQCLLRGLPRGGTLLLCRHGPVRDDEVSVGYPRPAVNQRVID